MSLDDGQIWFVSRRSPEQPLRKGLVPVKRAGYLTIAAFVLGEVVSLIAGMAVMIVYPGMEILGIAIIVGGVCLSMAFLFVMVARHTDRSVTLADYRARQAQPA
jgi:hypothetical protein